MGDKEENFMDKEKLVKKILAMMGSNDMEMTVENFVENCVKYALENNHCKMNWIARDLFTGNLSENEISELFDEK